MSARSRAEPWFGRRRALPRTSVARHVTPDGKWTLLAEKRERLVPAERALAHAADASGYLAWWVIDALPDHATSADLGWQRATFDGVPLPGVIVGVGRSLLLMHLGNARAREDIERYSQLLGPFGGGEQAVTPVCTCKEQP